MKCRIRVSVNAHQITRYQRYGMEIRLKQFQSVFKHSHVQAHTLQMILSNYVYKHALRISSNTVSIVSHSVQTGITEIKQQVFACCPVDVKTIFMPKLVQDCV